MKRQKITLIILSLCLLLTGCGTKYTTTEEAYVPDEDYQFQYYNVQSCKNELTESEDGYYFLIGNYIHYMDKETMQPIVLCQKPSCKHDKEDDPYIVADCNAFVRADWICYYKEKLYTIADSLSSSGADLIEVRMDGTGRKILYHFDIMPSYPVLHRGNLYYSIKAYYDDGTCSLTVQSISLTTSKPKSKIIYTSSLLNGDIFSLQPYCNAIYFIESGYVNDDVYRQVQVNYLNDEINILPGTILKNDVSYSIKRFGFYEGKILESWSTPSGNDYEFQYWYYDPLTGEREECIALPQESYQTRYSDGVYFYQHSFIENESNTYVGMYNKEGILIAEIPIDISSKRIIPGNEHLFVMDSISSYITAYRKSDLASGIVEPIQVLDVDINDYLKATITTVE